MDAYLEVFHEFQNILDCGRELLRTVPNYKYDHASYSKNRDRIEALVRKSKQAHEEFLARSTIVREVLANLQRPLDSGEVFSAYLRRAFPRIDPQTGIEYDWENQPIRTCALCEDGQYGLKTAPQRTKRTYTKDEAGDSTINRYMASRRRSVRSVLHPNSPTISHQREPFERNLKKKNQEKEENQKKQDKDKHEHEEKDRVNQASKEHDNKPEDKPQGWWKSLKNQISRRPPAHECQASISPGVPGNGSARLRPVARLNPTTDRIIGHENLEPNRGRQENYRLATNVHDNSGLPPYSA